MTEKSAGARVEGFVLPILISLALVSVSVLVGEIGRIHLAIGAALITVVVIGAFLSQYFAATRLVTNERTTLYQTLTALTYASKDVGRSTAILSESEVIAIESTAHEVWVYAYDLKWEEPGGALVGLVTENLRRGVHYRYLVPENETIFNRVRQLRRTHGSVRQASTHLTFRASTREKTLNQFGVSIYNPHFLTDQKGELRIDDHANDTVVVFYPHYQDFSVRGKDDEPLFLSFRGEGTRPLQESFVASWNRATVVPK